QPKMLICDSKFWIGSIRARRGHFLPPPNLIPVGSKTALSLGTQDWKERSAKSTSRERPEDLCDATEGGRSRRLLFLPHDGTPGPRSHRRSGLGFAWSSG